MMVSIDDINSSQNVVLMFELCNLIAVVHAL